MQQKEVAVAEVIKFFNRQTLSSGASSTDYYSDIYEVSEYDQIAVQLRAYGVTGYSITADIQTTFDNSFDNDSWKKLGNTLTVNTGTPKHSDDYTNPMRYVRAKLTIPQAVSGQNSPTFSLEGVARKST